MNSGSFLDAARYAWAYDMCPSRRLVYADDITFRDPDQMCSDCTCRICKTWLYTSNFTTKYIILLYLPLYSVTVKTVYNGLATCELKIYRKK